MRWPAVLVGIGIAGTLDEVVLHQLLHWHHFYDRSTLSAGLVSDGVFHLFSTVALVAGTWLLLRDGRPPRTEWRSVVAGVLVGAGAFNLFDGTVQHKLLRLHQVRAAADNDVPYDIAFIGVAAAVLLAGLALGRRTVQR